jgi:hypothetical protein
MRGEKDQNLLTTDKHRRMPSTDECPAMISKKLTAEAQRALRKPGYRWQVSGAKRERRANSASAYNSFIFSSLRRSLQHAL